MVRADRPNSLFLVHPGGLRARIEATPRPSNGPQSHQSSPIPGGCLNKSEGADLPTFRSILFPPGLEKVPIKDTGDPAYFVDLNLDQVMTAVVAKHDENILRPLFRTTYRNEEIIRYRQSVFADLECGAVFKSFPIFCEKMRSVRANLAYAGKISYKRHREMVILRAILLYCDTVEALQKSLETLTLRSAGLQSLQHYLITYSSSEKFARLSIEGRHLRDKLSALSYGMLFRGDRVTVRKYASEPDYTATILERFARFRDRNIVPPPPHQPRDDFSLNHIEEGILEFVSRLFSREFQILQEYVAQHSLFIDSVVERFDQEVGFFIAYLTYIEPLKQAGLPFCLPVVSASDKNTKVSASFDLALAAKLIKENYPVVCNSFSIRDAERLLVVSGPNQGGKTTFARMFGQLHFLAGLGCPVPGKEAHLFLPDQIFTHFEREEDITNLRGKLEDELVRIHRTCQAMTSSSIIILNEIFNSTSLDDQVFLSTKVLQQILNADLIGVCVTFIDSLSTLSENTVSMVSTVMPGDLARRTFEIIRKPADGLAYALSLAEKRGVTYERLRTRVQP